MTLTSLRRRPLRTPRRGQEVLLRVSTLDERAEVVASSGVVARGGGMCTVLNADLGGALEGAGQGPLRQILQD